MKSVVWAGTFVASSCDFFNFDDANENVAYIYQDSKVTKTLQKLDLT